MKAPPRIEIPLIFCAALTNIDPLLYFDGFRLDFVEIGAAHPGTSMSKRIFKIISTKFCPQNNKSPPACKSLDSAREQPMHSNHTWLLLLLLLKGNLQISISLYLVILLKKITDFDFLVLSDFFKRKSQISTSLNLEIFKKITDFDFPCT